MRRNLSASLCAVAAAIVCAVPPTSAQTEDDLPPERPDAPAAEPAPPPGAAAFDDRVVVSANGYPTDTERIGSSVSVLDPEDLARTPAGTLADLLRGLPGVEVTQGGGPGKATSVRIRGSDASQVLVLLDGVRLNVATTGDVDFADLLLADLERVEVLRGPQATYGSEATAGVISLTTRRARGPFELRLSGERGGLDTWRGDLAASGQRGGSDGALTLSRLSTDGVSHRATAATDPEPDGWRHGTASARLGHTMGAGLRADLTLRAWQGDTALDGFFGEDPNARAETTGTLGAFALETTGRRWRELFRVSRHDYRLVGADPDDEFNNYRVDSTLDAATSQTDYTWAGGGTSSAGLAWERRAARNLGSFDQRVSLRSAFLQHTASAGTRVHWSAAVRHDDHSTFGGETTWRTTLAAQPGGPLRWRATLGSSFRAPDANELFFPFAGNPRLRPETGSAADLGLDAELLAGRLDLGVTVFAQDNEDQIVFDLADFTFRNLADTRSRGAELVVHGRSGPRVAATLSHTWNDTKDRATGQPLPRRPEHRTTLDLRFDPHRRLRGSLLLVAVSDRIESTGAPMDDYQRADLRLESPLGRVRPFVRVSNRFDEDYEEVNGFTTAGRVVSVGVALRLRGAP